MPFQVHNRFKAENTIGARCFMSVGLRRPSVSCLQTIQQKIKKKEPTPFRLSFSTNLLSACVSFAVSTLRHDHSRGKQTEMGGSNFPIQFRFYFSTPPRPAVPITGACTAPLLSRLNWDHPGKAARGVAQCQPRASTFPSPAVHLPHPGARFVRFQRLPIKK